MAFKETKTIKSKPVKVDIYNCDICGNSILNYTWHDRCYICGRDMCKDHHTFIKFDKDYHTDICTICDKISFDYGKKYREIHEECDNKIKALYEEWSKESLSDKAII